MSSRDDSHQGTTAGASVRLATPADAGALARLVNMAGEGLPLHLWSAMAEPGLDPWEIGRQRALRETGGFSWRNATVIEDDEGVVAGLIGYPLADRPEPVDEADLPPIFVPLEQLESMAAGTWYVNVVAVEPRARRRGLGAALLALADIRAEETGRRGTSLIVSSANMPARALYERFGYTAVADRPIVKEGWANEGSAWILMLKGATPIA